MDELGGARAVVVGGGVVGLCMALELRRAGAECVLIDPAILGANASGVAAGMLAPAFESALDPAARGGFALLRDARDLWPHVLPEAVAIARDGAMWVAPPGEAAALAATEQALAREGAACERLTARTAGARAPGLTADLAGAIFTPDDWRVEPGPALRALDAAYRGLGGERRGGRVHGLGPTEVELDSAAPQAEAVVVCAGWDASAFAAAAPELAALRPIRGQIVRFPGAAPFDGPVVRSAAGYVAPSLSGALAGATMEAGVTAGGTTPAALAALADGAARLFPDLRGAAREGASGVRAATPDGLPLVGRSRGGVWLATGFRRNGWLLAPLAARIIAASLAGRDPGRWAQALRPDRALLA